MSRLTVKERQKLESEDTKYCGICKEVKPLFEFGVHAAGRKFSQAHCLECRRNGHLQETHGISLEDYDKLLEEQNNSCIICGTETPRGIGRFHVDHNHKTDKIRGLLCNNCNLGLGYFSDNPKTLVAAANYLLKTEK